MTAISPSRNKVGLTVCRLISNSFPFSDVIKSGVDSFRKNRPEDQQAGLGRRSGGLRPAHSGPVILKWPIGDMDPGEVARSAYSQVAVVALKEAPRQCPAGGRKNNQKRHMESFWQQKPAEPAPTR